MPKKTGRSKIAYSFTLERKNLETLRRKQRELRRLGYRGCTRSEVVRHALDQLNVEKVFIPTDIVERREQRLAAQRRRARKERRQAA